MSTSSALTYEALFARVQEIVARLESGTLSLEESLALYEEGIETAAACRRLLDQAVLRVQDLGRSHSSPEPHEV